MRFKIWGVTGAAFAALWSSALAGTAHAEDWWVTVGGSPTGAGTEASPWDLRTALCGGPDSTACAVGGREGRTAPAVRPGDRIWVHGGTYRGGFLSRLTGTQGAPITVSAVPGEHVVLDAFVQATLTADVDASSVVVSAAGRDGLILQGGDVLLVDGERITLRGQDGDRFSACTRGANATTARSHSAGAVALVLRIGLDLGGSYTVVHGFDIARTTPDARGRQYDIAWYDAIANGWVMVEKGVEIARTNVLEASFVHDHADGISTRGTVRDTLIFHNGYATPDGGNGNGMYLQNDMGTVSIRNVISFANFRTGMKAYASGDRTIRGFRFEHIIAFENGALADTVHRNARQANLEIAGACCNNTIEDNEVAGAFLFHAEDAVGPNLQIGYNDPVIRDVRVHDVEMIGGQLLVSGTRSGSFTDNVFASSGLPAFFVNFFPRGASRSDFTWDRNRYIHPSGPARAGVFGFCVDEMYNCDATLDFASWRAFTGWDAASNFVTSPRSEPAEARIEVWPTESEPLRAHVLLYTPRNAAGEVPGTIAISASVLSSFAALTPGARYRLRNVQDLEGDVREGVYDGTSIVVSTRGTVAAPFGMSVHEPSTLPRVGVFLLEVIEGGGGAMGPEDAGTQNGRDAGTGQSGEDGGAVTSADASRADEDAGTRTARESSGGCSCRTVDARSSSTENARSAAALLALTTLATRMRKRPRRQC